MNYCVDYKMRSATPNNYRMHSKVNPRMNGAYKPGLGRLSPFNCAFQLQYKFLHFRAERRNTILQVTENDRRLAREDSKRCQV